ncbi:MULTISPECIES: SpoIIE family protein phosphatase [Streptomyces]|uniref:Magnesium or manganese-dependent protein phosphatase n=1 Tax=Streptomyces sviceus (strain ATCC 29083 / DSM 924 / JCM 4929 / NBRC 13980 / NCIMB 11184 / NRRL 5439 / UC 5370) TaxID=463191 RepID=B5I3V5_STRX2|nr:MULTISPECIES: SpoIIE family protein phosphatase [Streptomyces]EDY59760.2 magnesium or manganese-dependent protein phosphatase [Streptomyces sviceus ATCC 29083]MYT03908.1 SpoIIE family protein phosphatase [Streptomyces sp. SID5470]
MRKPQIDYAAVFRALPGMVALLTPELVYVDVNDDFVRNTGRAREQLLGRYIFDVFPENPNDPAAAGMRETRESMLRAVATGERDTMAVLRYDIEDPQRPGHWREHFWSPVNAPVLGSDGKVTLVVHRVEEVTELIRARGGPGGDSRARVLEAELYTRARELQEVNERLRQAHAREREVALALQEALLPAPGPLGHHQAAVRYRPAVGTLNVCGDWYDLVDLPGDRFAVAVGDVVGHGLAAACVMGQLRSALSAATRVADGPARALEALGLYARSVAGAESTTAATAFIDWDDHTLTYSCAGHLPPVLLHPDGSVSFLDRATDPPLGASPEHGTRPEATTPFEEGATLVLYTDGLIERRTEDIDTGLARLTDALTRHRHAGPEELADALLAELLPPTGNADDTALVVIAL